MKAFFEENPEYKDNLMLLKEDGDSLSYGGFETFYAQVKDVLLRDSLAFLFCENSIGAVAFYLACLRNHVVPLLLDRHLDETLCESLIGRYDPKFVILPEEMAEKLDLKPKTHGIICEQYGYMVIRRLESKPLRLNSDLSLLLTTSGSTGSPKLVRQSLKNIESNASAIKSYLKIQSSDRPITSLPMQYTFGLSIINSHILSGATILLTNRSLFEREFWDFFRDGKATSISGVPYTFEMLKRLKFMEMDLKSLKIMTQAGGKLSLALHREFAEFALRTNRKFVVMYGQTEATARMAYLPADKALEKCGSIGIPIPGGHFRIMDDSKSEITEPFVVGELVYEGENVTMGYALEREDLEKGDEHKGVLYTGDMAMRDPDGFYYIRGRKKRFLKMFGKRVNMDEIEQMLKGKYPEIEVACVGSDDMMRLFVEGKDEKLCASIGEWISEKIGINIRAIRVCPIDEIPKNESGKILYKNLPDF